jgi:hypothetical protein
MQMPSDHVPSAPESPPPPSSDAPPDVQREGGPAERQRLFERERGLEPDVPDGAANDDAATETDDDECEEDGDA